MAQRRRLMEVIYMRSGTVDTTTSKIGSFYILADVKLPNRQNTRP